VPESAHQHALAPDWPGWKTAMLAQADNAEPYRPEPPKPRGGSVTKVVKVEAASSAETATKQSLEQPETSSAPDHPEQGDTDSAVAPEPSTTTESLELTEEEMDLLHQSGTDEITHTSDEALAEAGGGEVVDSRHGKKPRRDRLEHPSHRGGRS
jgi:hypothetical protein